MANEISTPAMVIALIMALTPMGKQIIKLINSVWLKKIESGNRQHNASTKNSQKLESDSRRSNRGSQRRNTWMMRIELALGAVWIVTPLAVLLVLYFRGSSEPLTVSSAAFIAMVLAAAMTPFRL